MNRQIKIFMLTDDNINGVHYMMDHYYSVNKALADKLENDDKAIKFEVKDELNQYEENITREVKSFKKRYTKMLESKDPRYKDTDFFAAELSKLKSATDEKVAQLQAEYIAIIKDIRQRAHEERANLTRNISITDETGAKQLMNDLIGVAKLDGIDKAIDRIESDIPYYSEGRSGAIANELHRLVDLVGEEDHHTKRLLRHLNNRLRDDSQGVELAARMANAMPDEIGYSYRTMKSTHPAYKRR